MNKMANIGENVLTIDILYIFEHFLNHLFFLNKAQLCSPTIIVGILGKHVHWKQNRTALNPRPIAFSANAL